ncbi:hypothetical protein BDV95DRAFT_95257 [Massariosphaeria phaeospora]|uniref:C2H2-type domain-containing protein n=1 Tax=Massariosphaeria phaeospora TaxID=100035 RepID=A0A7C8IBV3_9PLEO|nr:hypothetical protein BDV95DRAFT_95257 [Massariosphaeria phaeospora]
MAVLRRERRLARGIKNYHRRMELDAVAFRGANAARSRLFKQQNSERHAQTEKRILDNVRNDRRHACDLCDIALTSPAALRKHLGSKNHLENTRLAAAGKSKPALSRALNTQRRSVAKPLAAERHFCSTCNFNNATADQLKGHFRTQSYL